MKRTAATDLLRTSDAGQHLRHLLQQKAEQIQRKNGTNLSSESGFSACFFTSASKTSKIYGFLRYQQIQVRQRAYASAADAFQARIRAEIAAPAQIYNGVRKKSQRPKNTEASNPRKRRRTDDFTEKKLRERRWRKFLLLRRDEDGHWRRERELYLE